MCLGMTYRQVDFLKMEGNGRRSEKKVYRNEV